MAVVAILGILAAVGAPMYGGYLKRSKASEAVVVLAEIRNQQETYHSLPGGLYCNVSGTWDAFFPGTNPGASQQAWPNNIAWTNFLGRRHPQGYASTYFSYVTVAGGPGTTPANAGAPDALGYTGNDSWFVARAIGDLDDDGDNITFEIYSQSKHVFISHTAGWE